MEKLLQQFISEAKSDKKKIRAFKQMAVKFQQFELAVELREIEKTNFPPTQEEADAKKIGSDMEKTFSLAELKVRERDAWLIYQLSVLYQKKKDKTDLKSISKLKADCQRLFEE